jgi:murein DD-endopeptidase MepM/ murein hydrolase activator NlpD
MGGNMVYITHPDGTQTRYAHMSRIAAGYGQNVSTGTVIGYVGSTGASTGCHLHYETLQGGRFVDPRQFMAARGVYI